jgi:hypothetical protein
MVIEVSKCHESYNELLDDCEPKHFSPLTNVRVWVGVKITPRHSGHMRCMYRLRDPVGGGILEDSGATTGYISLSQPNTIEFVIPESEIFFDVTLPLPPTPFTIPGANALPTPTAPGIVTDGLVLSLEEIRDEIWASWPWFYPSSALVNSVRKGDYIGFSVNPVVVRELVYHRLDDLVSSS